MRTQRAQRRDVYLLWITVGVSGMVTACGPWASHAGQISFPCVGEIRTDGVNLRAGRSTNYEVLARLDRGARVTVGGLSAGWYRIMPPPNVPFWVSSRAISDGKVRAGRLNVRVRPSARSTAVCQLSRGEGVREIEQRGEWTSISAPRCAYLWVSSELVKLLPGDKGNEKPAESASGQDEGGEIQEQPAASAPPDVERAVIEGQPGAPPTVRLEPERIPRAYEGRIVKSEQAVISGAEHYLVTGFLRTRVLCLLKSRVINFRYYEGDNVKVWGYETTRLPSGIPLIDVRRLEVR